MAGTRRKAGQLQLHAAGYRRWLADRGYTAGSERNELKVLGQVGRWLDDEGLSVREFTDEQVAAFLAARRAAGFRRVPGLRGMGPLRGYLLQAGLLAEPVRMATPLEDLLDRYRAWMVHERGLAAATVLRYENTARRFLQQRSVIDGELRPHLLSGADVNGFLLQESARVSVGSAKGRVAELRSLLRFLYLQQLTPLRLGAAVPPVGGWRDAGIPASVTPDHVRALLDSCDLGQPVGVRDRAMITLLARLGLRSIEIARMRLEDLDWRTGELAVRGKARRPDRMPLPDDVGQALVAYLSVRPAVTDERHVFLTCKAPRCAIRADLVGDVVERACRRAGIPEIGPHRLRHALGAELLRRGAGLAAIGQVLRHQDLATTALYAKVDQTALRLVAQPWPGCRR